ncbi:glycosyltransferase [Rhodobacter sp. KR11]|uniref:glycosyltransferase n=1 Tax=Rhodobacter sp. KR11 TaxID=2974588 RepID=UPI0022224BF8|nr:glycosyltransferase [Rhodobacter sp. KR11]MCW1918420.1 glycosyltransferase [Rhodobacter sp. KR11]
MDQAPHQMREGLYALQPLVWPQPIHPVQGLTLRRQGAVDLAPGMLTFGPGGYLRLNTAYNIFPLGKWRRLCGLRDLRLVLRGTGLLTLSIKGETRDRPFAERHDLRLAGVVEVLLTDLPADVEILHLSFRCADQATLTEVTWATTDAPKRLPRLALSITTYHREAQVARTIARFVRETQGDHLRLIVVDNGQTLTAPDHPRIRLVPNRNLGGAGGFARGMAEARAEGASHCLFMDDDAALDFASVDRIWTFLAHVTDPRTAIAGALTSAEQPTELWENGAVFRGHFQPLARGLDLAVPADLLKAELLSTPVPTNFYGGFWCYAFPLDHVTHAPFPFFVRGDDTSFCIANGFSNVTLPGVLCYQDVDFSEKETSLTLYLDLRSNLIHLVTLPRQSLRLWRAVILPARFFGRCLMQHQTDSMAALNRAVEDFRAGPGFVEAEPDLASRRADLAAARRVELWTPSTNVPAPRQRFNPHSRLQRLALALTLNGLLAPGFGRWGDRVVLSQKQRGVVRFAWGAAEITYVSTDGGRVMQIRQNKPEALRQSLRMAWNLMRLVAAFPRLRRVWARGYTRMTRPEWWENQR